MSDQRIELLTKGTAEPVAPSKPQTGDATAPPPRKRKKESDVKKSVKQGSKPGTEPGTADPGGGRRTQKIKRNPTR
jgi:hypothetical protein